MEINVFSITIFQPKLTSPPTPTCESSLALSPTRIELRLPFRWDSIEPARQSIAFALQARFDDPLLAEKLAMAASELLENAIKYGAPSPVDLRLQQHADQLCLSVENAVASESPSVSNLMERIDYIRGCPDAQAAYVQAMTEIYRQGVAGLSSSQSTLGLLRIAAEAGCQLSYSPQSDGRVRVEAACRVAEQEPS